MAKQISRKNGRILRNKIQPLTPKCNCQVSHKADCLLLGQCTVKNICYMCKVTRLDDNSSKCNVGITVQMAKSRFKQHIDDAKKWRPNATGIEMSKLSQHIGGLIFSKIPYKLEWSVLVKANPHDPVTDFCSLCNSEKYFIMHHPEFSDINFRSELYGNCSHRKRNLLIDEVT